MFKLLLMLFYFSPDTAINKHDQYGSDTIKPMHYSGGALSEPIDYNFEKQDFDNRNNFKDPFNDVKVHDYSKYRNIDFPDIVGEKGKSEGNVIESKTSAENRTLDRLVNTPSSPSNQTSIKTFDWKKANTDLFVNSPCYHDLGFDLNKDPQLQGKEYQECESGKTDKKISNGLTTLLVLAGFTGIIVFAFRSNKSQ